MFLSRKSRSKGVKGPAIDNLTRSIARNVITTTKDETSPECIDAILTLIRLPPEIRIEIFRHDRRNYFTYSTTSASCARSPLFRVLAELATTSDTWYQTLLDEYLATWSQEVPDRSIAVIRKFGSPLALQQKTRVDRLAIQHMVFNLPISLEIRDEVKWGGNMLTIDNNLKTISFLSGTTALAYRQDIFRLIDTLYWLAPAALRTLESVIIEVHAEDGVGMPLSEQNRLLEGVEERCQMLDTVLGATHQSIQNPRGDRFWVWDMPFGREYTLSRRSGHLKIDMSASTSTSKGPTLSKMQRILSKLGLRGYRKIQ